MRVFPSFAHVAFLAVLAYSPHLRAGTHPTPAEMAFDHCVENYQQSLGPGEYRGLCIHFVDDDEKTDVSDDRIIDCAKKTGDFFKSRSATIKPDSAAMACGEALRDHGLDMDTVLNCAGAAAKLNPKNSVPPPSLEDGLHHCLRSTNETIKDPVNMMGCVKSFMASQGGSDKDLLHLSSDQAEVTCNHGTVAQTRDCVRTVARGVKAAHFAPTDGYARDLFGWGVDDLCVKHAAESKTLAPKAVACMPVIRAEAARHKKGAKEAFEYSAGTCLWSPVPEDLAKYRACIEKLDTGVRSGDFGTAASVCRTPSIADNPEGWLSCLRTALERGDIKVHGGSFVVGGPDDLFGFITDSAFSRAEEDKICEPPTIAVAPNVPAGALSAPNNLQNSKEAGTPSKGAGATDAAVGSTDGNTGHVSPAAPH